MSSLSDGGRFYLIGETGTKSYDESGGKGGKGGKFKWVSKATRSVSISPLAVIP